MKFVQVGVGGFGNVWMQVLGEFLAALNGGPRPATAVDDNIKSVAMVFATVKAMATGRPARIL